MQGNYNIQWNQFFLHKMTGQTDNVLVMSRTPFQVNPHSIVA